MRNFDIHLKIRCDYALGRVISRIDADKGNEIILNAYKGAQADGYQSGLSGSSTIPALFEDEEGLSSAWSLGLHLSWEYLGSQAGISFEPQ